MTVFLSFVLIIILKTLLSHELSLNGSPTIQLKQILRIESFSSKIVRKRLKLRDHLFSMYSKYSDNLHFFPVDMYAHV